MNKAVAVTRYCINLHKIYTLKDKVLYDRHHTIHAFMIDRWCEAVVSKPFQATYRFDVFIVMDRLEHGYSEHLIVFL